MATAQVLFLAISLLLADELIALTPEPGLSQNNTEAGFDGTSFDHVLCVFIFPILADPLLIEMRPFLSF